MGGAAALLDPDHTPWQDRYWQFFRSHGVVFFQVSSQNCVLSLIVLHPYDKVGPYRGTIVNMQHQPKKADSITGSSILRESKRLCNPVYEWQSMLQKPFQVGISQCGI